MRLRRGWGPMAGLALAGLLLVGACGAERRHAAHSDDDPADFSDDRFDDLDEEGAMTDLLDPEERDATERSELPGDARPDADKQNAGDTAGKVGPSGLTLAPPPGAAGAPFPPFLEARPGI